MKLYILSDLHLEFSTFEPSQTDADVVVLAGDIGKGTRGIEWARNAFPDIEIVYVPGNHEFYGAQRLETLAAMRTEAMENGVRLLDEDDVVIHSQNKLGSVRILGCTLWTDFMLFGETKKSTAMSDGQLTQSVNAIVHRPGVSPVLFQKESGAKRHWLLSAPIPSDTFSPKLILRDCRGDTDTQLKYLPFQNDWRRKARCAAPRRQAGG